MKRRVKWFILVFILLVTPLNSFAVEVAPRISDREIVERLTRLEEGQRRLEGRLEEGQKAILREMDKRFNDMNKRIDMLMWIMGLFVTVSLVILGAVVRVQWQLNRRQAGIEKEAALSRDEMSFLKDAFLKTQDQLKSLIESLKLPRDVL